MDRFQNTGQPAWDWWGKLWPTPGSTLREFGITTGTAIAEVACGNGYFALPASRITDPARVYALDIDESLLDELTNLADRQGIENIVPIHGDARSLTQHLPKLVDVVLTANTFHGIDDRAGFVHQAFESLRPGGRFIIVNWSDQPRETTTIAGEPRGPPTDLRMSPDETAAAVVDTADFSLTEQLALPPYHYALLFDR